MSIVNNLPFDLKGNISFISAIIGLCLICSTCEKTTKSDDEDNKMEPPETLWTKTYGGINWDKGHSVQQTSDGGYIITGLYDYFGNNNGDVLLIKTDASGEMLWLKTYGGVSYDAGESVQQTTDGGYIVVGTTESYGAGFENLWIIKTDAAGDTLWSKTFGESGWNEGISIQQNSDGGYIITGYINDPASTGNVFHNVWVIKTDASGNKLWINIFEGRLWGEGRSIQKTSDSGYIITGVTASYDTEGVLLIKTDAEGDTLWIKTVGSNIAMKVRGESVQQTSEGGYIITGYINDSVDEAGSDLLLIKTDAAGEMLWKKTFGGSGYDVGESVQQSADDGYVIVGTTASYGAGDKDLWVIKTDASGEMLWSKTFGGNDYDGGRSIQQTQDGGFIITGFTSLNGAGSIDVWLIRLAPK